MTEVNSAGIVVGYRMCLSHLSTALVSEMVVGAEINPPHHGASRQEAGHGAG